MVLRVRDSRSDLCCSPLLARFRRNGILIAGLQYSVSKHQVYAANYGLQWQRTSRNTVLNAEYRYLRSSPGHSNGFELLNVSGPVANVANRLLCGGAQSVIRLPERQTVKSLAGFEYNADCWVFRFAAQRFSTSTTGATTTLCSCNLNLNGLIAFRL